MPETAKRPPIAVGIVVTPGFQVLDATGPAAILTGVEHLQVVGDHPIDAQPDTNAPADDRPYAVTLLGPEPGPVRTSSGFAVVAGRSYADFDGPLDTLLVAGGSNVATLVEDRVLHRFLIRMAPRVRRLGSVCTGAFALAAAGLLDGRRAVTHWQACHWLARDYPRVTVEPDPIFIQDGPIYTSAGVTAGMDLALRFVEEDWGRDTALKVARQKVMYMVRPGGQSQFSAQLLAQQADGDRLGAVRQWILDNVAEPITVPALAERACMSERNFLRVFQKEIGMSPARFVELARVDAARRRLEDSVAGVEQIAYACGFGHPERMRRAFQKHLGICPNDYRARFHRPPYLHQGAA